MHNPWQDISAQQGQQMDQHQQEGLDGFRLAIKRAALWDLIDRHLPGPAAGPVLDAGGGTGTWTLPLAERGYQVVLADISPGLLERADEKLRQAGLEQRVRLECLGLDALAGLPDGTFVAAVALGAPLSYTHDPGQALAELHRVSASGAWLIGDGENRYRAGCFPRLAPDWPAARRALLEGRSQWPDPANPAPVWLFTPPQVRRLLKRAGWQVMQLLPSDVVASIVHAGALAALAAEQDGVEQALALERRLREDRALLTAGRDIQFVARKQ